MANRVSQIQKVTNPNYWYHVKSLNNPGDCLSRESSVNELLKNTLWWEDPQFLRCDDILWTDHIAIEEITDIPKCVVANTC